MTKPTSCHVGVRTYEIIWVDHTWTRTTDFIGLHDADPCRIHVRGDLQPPLQASVLMHEIMHALIDSVPDSIVEDKKLLEEDVCCIVGNQLTTFWMRNPDVLKWYCEAILI